MEIYFYDDSSCFFFSETKHWLRTHSSRLQNNDIRCLERFVAEVQPHLSMSERINGSGKGLPLNRTIDEIKKYIVKQLYRSPLNCRRRSNQNDCCQKQRAQKPRKRVRGFCSTAPEPQSKTSSEICNELIKSLHKNKRALESLFPEFRNSDVIADFHKSRVLMQLQKPGV